MRIPDSLAVELVLKSGRVNDQQVNELYEQSKSDKLPLQDLFIIHGYISEASLTKLYAENIGLNYYEIKPSSLNHKLLTRLPLNIAAKYRVVVVAEKDDGVMLASADSLDNSSISFLSKILGNIELVIASESKIEEVLDSYFLNNSDLIKTVNITETRIKNSEVSESDKNFSLNKTIETLLLHAIKSEADSIHIEPQDKHLSVRLRIDGVLVEDFKLPISLTAKLNAQIDKYFEAKVLSSNDAKEGYRVIEVSGIKYELKMYSIKTFGGVKILISIIGPFNINSLTDMGLVRTNLKLVSFNLSRENGLILVSGPDNSGKSSLLHTMAKMLSRSDLSIVSLDKEPSRHIPGVTQIELKPGRLRQFDHIMAQQPQVVLIDEIEYRSSADFAVEASIGGRLIIGSIAAPTAAHAAIRLISMGVPPYSISSVLKSSINSLVARKLCEVCKIEFKPSRSYIEEIDKRFNLTKFGGIESVLTQAKTNYNIKTNGNLTKLYKPNNGGCDNCHGSGYKGRIGLYEVMENSDALTIDLNASVSYNEIFKHAISSGMIPLEIDGLVKAVAGLTSIDEILRAIKFRPANILTG